ncbi:MAG: hypothetical protein NXI28_27060 [bacterium]|nr:hypothetical protein [bacterium]
MQTPKAPTEQPDSSVFSLAQVSAVAVGAINTSIIHPAWLAEVGLLDDSSLASIELDLQQPGLRLTGPPDFGKWLIRPDRLTVETENAGVRPGSKVAKILELLPWTPVVAVGLNYRFAGPPSAAGKLAEIGFPTNFVVPGYSVPQRGLHVALSKEGEVTVRHLQLSLVEDELQLHVNFHTDTKKLDTQQTVKTLKRCDDGLAEIREIVQASLGIEIE